RIANSLKTASTLRSLPPCGKTGVAPLPQPPQERRDRGRKSGGREQAGEQAPAVEPAMGCLDQVFGVRHQAEHILFRVENARDVVERAIGIGALRVAEGDL